MSSPTEITIPTPDDWHVHLRDGGLLRAVVPYTAAMFRYAMVMPNLEPPITTTLEAAKYRDRILQASGNSESFVPLTTLYLTEDISIPDVIAGYRDGVVHAVKLYPAGVTTNSAHGAQSLRDVYQAIEQFENEGIPLLVHAESTDQTIDIFAREAAFLVGELSEVCDKFPGLLLTVEHVSTATGVEFVREHRNVAATITPHHLILDRSDLLGSGLRADLYCKPILNRAQDRDALVAAATSGDPKFFLGTDSAPHTMAAKSAVDAKPGIFSAPNALTIVADVFARRGALEELGRFVGENGSRHYGLQPSERLVRLRRIHSGSNQQGEPDFVSVEEDRIPILNVSGTDRWTVDLDR